MGPSTSKVMRQADAVSKEYALAQAAARAALRPALARVVDAVSRVIWGHTDTVRLALAAMLARGHVLLEDVPGVGKTTLARAFAKVLGCSFARIQFTADLLPGDVLGVQVLDPHTGELRFRRGPIFADVVLADEINRASPRTQSAMLEAMAERRVTVDDATYDLAPVFTVLATQNPLEHHGAYPLPESQLDRFMVRLRLGYPPAHEERRLVMATQAPETAMQALTPQLSSAELLAAGAAVKDIHLSEPLADYLMALIQATRTHAQVVMGASPRAAMAFANMARAHALLSLRDFVIPDDIQLLAKPMLSHRLVLTGAGGPEAQRQASAALLDELVARLPVPR